VQRDHGLDEAQRLLEELLGPREAGTVRGCYRRFGEIAAGLSNDAPGPKRVSIARPRLARGGLLIAGNQLPVFLN
jgi:hypothetical protein